jgi:hypothetical protein
MSTTSRPSAGPSAPTSAKARAQLRHPYASRAYAEALGFAGRPIEVADWAAFVIGRDIAGGPERDAIGPYPRAVLDRSGDLEGGLQALAGEGLVSVVLVADPVAGPPSERLARAFSLCRPFKTHQIIERAKGYAPDKHHRYEIRRAQARCEVSAVSLADRLDVWRTLYQGLAERHEIAGMAAFSDSYFEALAAAPVFEAFAATVGDEIAAMAIWFEHDGLGCNHLGASNALGYANGASYALYAAAIERFAQCEVIDLGAGAGLADDPSDGLVRFKRGFANATAVAHLCGAVLDEDRYAALSQGRAQDGFFPAYRAPG